MENKEEYEGFFNELIDIEERIEANKKLINTSDLELFYERALHNLRWLRYEVEEKIQ